MTDIPAEAIDAAAHAIHQFRCPDAVGGTCLAGPVDADFGYAKAALEASAPFIAAAQLKRDIQLAEQEDARVGVWHPGVPNFTTPFADVLLREDGDADAVE